MTSGDELVGELRQGAGGSLALNDLSHLLADGTDFETSERRWSS